MNQGNVIFGALFLGFLIYITMKGELPTYMGFFIPGSGETTPVGGTTSTGKVIGSGPGEYASPSSVLPNAAVSIIPPNMRCLHILPDWLGGACPPQ